MCRLPRDVLSTRAKSSNPFIAFGVNSSSVFGEEVEEFSKHGAKLLTWYDSAEQIPELICDYHSCAAG